MKKLTTSLCLLLASLAALLSFANADCNVSISQTARNGGSWMAAGINMQIYDIAVVNTGSSPVTTLVISITFPSTSAITSFWNLQMQSATSNLWNVVNPGDNIAVGATLSPGFILAGGDVPITQLVSVSCIVSTPQPSSQPSSQPSPSSSPVDSSGCSFEVSSITARSDAAGGNWTTGPGQFFQIFDISFFNNGQNPVTGGVITFGLPLAGSSITQWWELNPQTNVVYDVAFNYGPLQVGASQGAGIVVETSVASQAVASTLLSNIVCSS